MRLAELFVGDVRHFVAVIAVHAAGSRAPCFAQIVIRRIVKGDCGGVAGRTDACPVRMFVQKAPPDIPPSLPVAAFVKVKEMAIAHGTGMAAGSPLLVDLAVTMATVLPLPRIRLRISPDIMLIIF